MRILIHKFKNKTNRNFQTLSKKVAKYDVKGTALICMPWFKKNAIKNKSFLVQYVSANFLYSTLPLWPLTKTQEGFSFRIRIVRGYFIFLFRFCTYRSMFRSFFQFDDYRTSMIQERLTMKFVTGDPRNIKTNNSCKIQDGEGNFLASIIDSW